MTALAWLRPSSAPRLAACPASGIASEGLPAIDSDAAALGRALHEIAQMQALGLSPDLEAIAQGNAVSAALLAELAQALQHLPTADGSAKLHAERDLVIDLGDGLEIAGRADLILEHEDGEWCEVVDLKSGNPDFADDGVWDQLGCYAVGAGQTLHYEVVRASAWYVRLGADGWRHRDLVVDEERVRLRAVFERALWQRDLPPEQREYRVGEACTFCAARAVCPARAGEVRSFLATVMDPPITVESWTAPLLTAENIGRFDARLRIVEKLVKAAQDARKDFVRASGGRVELGDGYALELASQTRRAYSVPESTSEVLRRVKC